MKQRCGSTSARWSPQHHRSCRLYKITVLDRFFCATLLLLYQRVTSSSIQQRSLVPAPVSALSLLPHSWLLSHCISRAFLIIQLLPSHQPKLFLPHQPNCSFLISSIAPFPASTAPSSSCAWSHLLYNDRSFRIRKLACSLFVR